MKTDEILIAQIEDKILRANDWGIVTSGDFLDTHQRKVVADHFRSVKLPVQAVFYGGYGDAERCMPVFLPEGFELDRGQIEGDEEMPEYVSELLSVIRINVPKGGKVLTHRDYLGSLLALGIDREVTGDILVKGSAGADIIVETEIAPFIEMNYTKAGRTSLDVTVHPIAELQVGEINIVKKQDTVASLRLDNIVASAFSLSRAKAAEAIRRGIVSVNSIEALKVDMDVHEMDKIVMRGRGKVVLSDIGGTSRKERIRITFDMYK